MVVDAGEGCTGMVSIKISENVAAQPERVFSFISDFEKAPQYSNYWKSVKVLSREGNSATYETVAEAEGRKIASVTKVTSFPNERIEAETVDGDGKGTRLAFKFQNTPPGTQITLEGDIVLPGFAKMLGGLVKGRIESGMREELAIVKRAVEKA
jgi:uncharacterized membrane protein